MSAYTSAQRRLGPPGEGSRSVRAETGDEEFLASDLDNSIMNE